VAALAQGKDGRVSAALPLCGTCPRSHAHAPRARPRPRPPQALLGDRAKVLAEVVREAKELAAKHGRPRATRLVVRAATLGAAGAGGGEGRPRC
jgi:hypothetical protein